jgi:hypothetical protein
MASAEKGVHTPAGPLGDCELALLASENPTGHVSLLGHFTVFGRSRPLGMNDRPSLSADTASLYMAPQILCHDQ